MFWGAAVVGFASDARERLKNLPTTITYGAQALWGDGCSCAAFFRPAASKKVLPKGFRGCGPKASGQFDDFSSPLFD